MKLLRFLMLFASSAKFLQVDTMHGGNFHGIEDAPYLVYIYFANAENRNGILHKYGECSGSIISEYWILSAAHCMKGDYYQKTAQVGTHLKNSNRGTSYDIVKIIVHGDYEVHNSGSVAIYGDISLLKVETSIEFSQFVQPIPISNVRPKPGEVITFAGYGAGQFNIPHEKLQIANVSVISDEICKKQWLDNNMILENNSFCLEPKYVIMGVGDSGGPAILNGKVVGVLSAGGDYNTQPDILTNVANYYDWILKHTGIHYVD